MLIKGVGFLIMLIAIGALAAHVERNPAIDRRLGLLIAILMALTLVVSIINGDLFRYKPGAQDDLGEEREFIR